MAKYTFKVDGEVIKDSSINNITCIQTDRIILPLEPETPQQSQEGGKVSKTKTVKDVKKTIKEKATINPSVASNKPKPTPKPKIKN